MEKKRQLSWLVARVTQLLRAKKYKEGYIRTYLRTWEQLKMYVSRLGVAAYDRSVGEAFLEERFGKVAYHQLKRTWKEVFHRVEVLSHYQEKGDLLKQHIRAPVITFSDKLGEPCAAFIEYSKEIKRSEGTIENYRKCVNILYQ